MDHKCEIVRDLLPTYIDGLCSDESKEFIENHINDCQSCKEILHDMRAEVSLTDENEKLTSLKAKKPFKKLRNRLIFSISSAFILLAILCGIFVYDFLNKANPVATNELFIQEVEVVGETLTIVGDTTSSALGFHGYEFMYSEDEETLYFIPRYQLVNKHYSSGRFEISHDFGDNQRMDTFDISNMNQIFLQGKSSDDRKLIWERE
ncbi:zf-HC2 domain-containing protein [Evansella sp. AB-rgal1]|uniref:zf-HC2 domain-containing protein n=1 Tax=Evansella sp. AB-rgal1 TaxID=3242696 RepID=UPI00359EAB49